MGLDSDYRARWEEYHLADGTVKDSRYTYWRDVQWERVIKLVVNIRNNRFEVAMQPNHKAFIRYRTQGRLPHWDSGGEYDGRRVEDCWVFGWTDGEKCFMREVNFKTGKLEREFVEPLAKNKNHLHPRIHL